MPHTHATPEAFIAHWSKAAANERANSQSFLIGLAHLIGVPAPSNDHHAGYSFEYPVKVPGGTSTNFLDLYKRACFVLESKQFTAQKLEQSRLELAAQQAGAIEIKAKSGPVRGTGQWDDAMIRAKGQAERYVRSLPADEPNPPFIIVCDVGHSLEIYADFTQAGKAYLPFPDPRTFRIQLKDLEKEEVRARLKLIWTNPTALDPAKVSADVTREIAGYLAELAKSLEEAGHHPETVAQFLTRCLFCMFAEDVGLLPDRAFTELLDSVPKDGTGFPELIGTLFKEMNTGTGGSISVILRKKLLKFNGGLFADQTVLPVNGLQLGLLKQASKTNWRSVEPAIFGTLLERALVPEERHALGAHFTPRAYVERLVLPTVMEPLREEWENVRAAALTLANKDKMKDARAEVNRFHDQLCQTTVLDPACGSGNFLYVALEHMKRLEGEVIDFASELGADQRLDLSTHTVDPHQFLGIELNPRAAAIAEMVLWIGYLQWHFRTRGQTMPEEPVLKSFKNIECRDAVLAYEKVEPARDDAGNEITVWDRRSYKTDLVTNRDVPDETKRVPLLTYLNPKPADWPSADYIVGNPPFIGNKRMRDALGDGYVESLRATYPGVPDTSDFVMFWWHKAAESARSLSIKQFGFITTNSLKQTQGRQVVEAQMKSTPPLSLIFAIPDHPWVDGFDGASVRIAMTCAKAGVHEGELLSVTSETPNDDGSSLVNLTSHRGRIASDLTVGADTTSTVPLEANLGVCFQGMNLVGEGFRVAREEVEALGFSISSLPPVIKPYQKGRELVQGGDSGWVIDCYGLSAEQLREEYPAVYQHLLVHVKPDRDLNKRDSRRKNWWLFGEPVGKLRKALSGLRRYIATVETARHRTFVFVDTAVIPDHKLYAVATDDAFVLGVLSCRLHTSWALTSGGRLGVGNDPTWTNTTTFYPFPFPLCTEEQKERIRGLAEELDAHRKRVQAAHGLTLTGLYNVLEKLRAQQPLTDKEKAIHDKGLVSILKQLHDDLDAAVSAAYGWPTTLSDAEILERLVALNAQRAAEEKQGIIHWLRPDYQRPQGAASTEQGVLKLKTKPAKTAKPKTASTKATKQPWPATLAERIRATEAALHAAGKPVTATDLTTHFTRAKPADLLEILESLVALGRAHQNGDAFSV